PRCTAALPSISLKCASSSGAPGKPMLPCGPSLVASGLPPASRKANHGMPPSAVPRAAVSRSWPPTGRSTSILQSTNSLPTRAPRHPVLELVAPRAPGRAEVQEDAAAVLRGRGLRVAEQVGGGEVAGLVLREESHHLLRVVAGQAGAALERTGLLVHDDAAVG